MRTTCMIQWHASSYTCHPHPPTSHTHTPTHTRLEKNQVGATNAMRMEAVAKDGRKVVLRYAHEDLEVCVGIATAAFVVATLRGDVSLESPPTSRVFFRVFFLFGNSPRVVVLVHLVRDVPCICAVSSWPPRAPSFLSPLPPPSAPPTGCFGCASRPCMGKSLSWGGVLPASIIPPLL